MPTQDPPQISVFYAWQSDSPATTNRNLIRNCLRKASSLLENDPGSLTVVLDEATRGVPGSPNIPETIFRKIRNADIFVGDITSINPGQPPEERVPNPNVLVELGFAAAELGWNRIILLCNSAFGTPEDAPFDIDRHRISVYQIAESDLPDQKKSRTARKSLETLLSAAISLIVKANPPRPREVGLTPAEIRRERDERTIRQLLLELHIPTFEEHIRTAPHIIPGSALYFWEGLNGLVASHTFHLYDARLFKYVRAIHSAVRESMAHDSEYQPSNSGDRYIFTNPMDLPLPRDRKKIWDTIDSALRTLNKNLGLATKHIRDHYVGIDIEQLNARAWAKYVAFRKEIRRELEGV